MANYYDIDDILAEEENVLSVFRQSADGVGVLDSSDDTHKVPSGSKMKLPFWLARDLHLSGVVSMDVPLYFKKDGRRGVLWNWPFWVFEMGTKMKGIYKYISNIFVVEKEAELEIGGPTDVNHVAHIGWEGTSSTSAPSWMTEFKTGPDYAATTIGNNGSSLSPWSSQAEHCKEDMTKSPKPKQKRKKSRPATTLSPRGENNRSLMLKLHHYVPKYYVDQLLHGKCLKCSQLYWWAETIQELDEVLDTLPSIRPFINLLECTMYTYNFALEISCSKLIKSLSPSAQFFC